MSLFLYTGMKIAQIIPQCAPKTQNNPNADPSPSFCIQFCHFCHDSSQKRESHHPDLFAFGQLPTGQNKVLLSSIFRPSIAVTSSFDAHMCTCAEIQSLGQCYLNCNSILLNFILGHISAITTPLGHHFRLAMCHLVHFLDVIVQVARSAACVLADRTYPRLCSAVD